MVRTILDLFCGAGGASVGLHRAFPKAQIVGVDIHDQPHYPFDFDRGDALKYQLGGFDFIWASPPCQRYSAMQMIHSNKAKHPDLIDPIRQRLIKTEGYWVIENVVRAPLKNPTLLCGTMFGLPIAMHRLFETNFELPLLTLPCKHKNLYDPYHGGEMARGERKKFAKAKGIDWEMTRQEVREAIPPAYSEWVGRTCSLAPPRKD